MKFYLILLLFIYSQNNLFGIEQYSSGDTLYVWATKLNLRTTPDLNSEVVNQILQNEKIIVDQNKYSKDNDFLINKNAKNWEKAITGIWVKVIYKNKIGYLFDAYLSKYDFPEIQNFENYISSGTSLNKIGFEISTRKKYESGIIKEEGIGNEWGKTIYYIFDFSIEEAILFIKKEGFEYPNGKQKWEIDLDKFSIQMNESDGSYHRSLNIKKIENLTIIAVEDGM